MSQHRKCVFIHLDPCVARPCRAPYAVCRAVRDRAECSCKENCPRVDNPVCGSNYKTYRNKCLMELEACQSGTMIRARSNGRCPGERVKPYSQCEIFHWLLNNNSNNCQHFLTIYYCMFVYDWSVLELRFGLLILSFYPMGSFVLRVEVDSGAPVKISATILDCLESVSSTVFSIATRYRSF